jgi:hypothetical protein
LTTGRGLLTVASGFGFRSRSSRPIVSRASSSRALFASTGSARALRTGTARAYARTHAGFTADPAKEASLRLFDNFDLRVVTVHAQVGEGAVGRLFD